MGITRFIIKTSPIFLAKELIVKGWEEESLSGGVKKLVKETVTENIPGVNVIYSMGVSDGEKKGYVRASKEYEKKFREQARMFIEQRGLFESQIEEYQKILDAYETCIMQYEVKYGMSIDSASNEEKKEWFSLLAEKHILSQMSNVKLDNEIVSIDKEMIKKKILEFDFIKENDVKSYKDIEKLDDINESMAKHDDECVFLYDPSFVGYVFGKIKHGIVFGMNGLMFFDSNKRYVTYEQISYSQVKYLPPALYINVSGESNIVCEGISYAQENLVEIIERMQSYSKKNYSALNNFELKEKVKKILDLAWRKLDYPGHLITDYIEIKNWLECIKPEWENSNVNLDDICGVYKELGFTVVFTYNGFVMEHVGKMIEINYLNIDAFDIKEDTFWMKLIDDSYIEIVDVNLQFINAVFDRISKVYVKNNKSKLQ